MNASFSRMLATLLALIGLLDASYLAIERLRGGEPFCPIGGGCATVQNSPFAVLFGLPIAYLGVLAYMALFALLLVSLSRVQMFGLPMLIMLLAVSSVGVLFSLYLTYLQLAVIHAVCFWCVVSALIQLTVLVLLVREWRAGREQSPVGAVARG